MKISFGVFHILVFSFCKYHCLCNRDLTKDITFLAPVLQLCNLLLLWRQLHNADDSTDTLHRCEYYFHQTNLPRHYLESIHQNHLTYSMWCDLSARTTGDGCTADQYLAIDLFFQQWSPFSFSQTHRIVCNISVFVTDTTLVNVILQCECWILL